MLLYLTLFSLYFGIGNVLGRMDNHTNMMFAYPLALLLLLYFPALLMLGKTRRRLEAFTMRTFREGIYFCAIFAGFLVVKCLVPALKSDSPFNMLFPVMLCVKTITIFREGRLPKEEGNG